VTALTPPFMVAALVLIVAGVAKIRSPEPAALAMRTLGMPIPPAAIRTFAAAEMGLGATAALYPGSLISRIAVAAVYTLFAGLSLMLARRRSGCGCFGERDIPASMIGSLLSAALAGIAAATIGWTPHSLGWILSQAPAIGAVTTLGIIAATYAAIVAYTDLPLAWEAWSGR
jgi:hypothetical protein